MELLLFILIIKDFNILAQKDLFMTERLQRTAAGLREKMMIRYGDGLSHKHNKNHLQYRLHSKSHPSQPANRIFETNLDINYSSGLVREFKLKKMRKRLDKGRYH